MFTIDEAISQWPELSETPPLYQFVDAERLNGLFKTKAVDNHGWAPSVEFQFQGCRVTLLYSSSVRVIIERDR
ncbi:HalOD1 output domain-containing protein [Halorubrum sp. Hd13]|uniref:HalOD1 output domain-containing protein n=1 Tax=Halorubrum sp. Hd13 TaxID=1480728 RepID=UPI0037435BCB